jgi:hypothetical protein
MVLTGPGRRCLHGDCDWRSDRPAVEALHDRTKRHDGQPQRNDHVRQREGEEEQSALPHRRSGGGSPVGRVLRRCRPQRCDGAQYTRLAVGGNPNRIVAPPALTASASIETTQGSANGVDAVVTSDLSAPSHPGARDAATSPLPEPAPGSGGSRRGSATLERADRCTSKLTSARRYWHRCTKPHVRGLDMRPLAEGEYSQPRFSVVSRTRSPMPSNLT